MEKNEVSLHQVKVFLFVKNSAGWLTNSDIAKGSEIALRTARQHTKTFVDLGMFEHAEVFPGHRFKLSVQAEKRNKPYWLRLCAAAEIFGLSS